MSDDFDRVVDRVQQNRARGSVIASAASSTGASRPLVTGSTLRAGDRVFDLVSGIEAIVEPAPVRAAGGPVLIAARVADGRLLLRAPEQLVPRPTPPSVSA